MSTNLQSDHDMTSDSRRRPGGPSPFANPNYLRYWISAAISDFGDFFTIIALPWLVLSISPDPAHLGAVMALETLPRALFMLIGGSVTDRFAPRRVLLASKGCFMLALLALAALTLGGQLSIHLLYGFAFLFGLLTAFTLPATSALMPQLLDKPQIQAGNSAMMGTQQTIQLFAPVLAGLMIWGSAGAPQAQAAAELRGLAYAFLLNAGAIVVAITILLGIRLPSRPAQTGTVEELVVDGLRYLRRDRGLRIVSIYVTSIGLFAIGPIMTVIPQFATQRLANGALSYGLLFTLSGVGSLIGYALSSMLPKPSARRLGLVMFSADLVSGMAVVLLGHSYTLAGAAAALIVTGACNGFGVVLCMSWIQERVPENLMGRVMSIMMFAVMGLTPLSMMASGFLLTWHSLLWLLTLCGGAMMALALLGLAVPALNRFGECPVPRS